MQPKLTEIEREVKRLKRSRAAYKGIISRQKVELCCMMDQLVDANLERNLIARIVSELPETADHFRVAPGTTVCCDQVLPGEIVSTGKVIWQEHGGYHVQFRKIGHIENVSLRVQQGEEFLE